MTERYFRRIGLGEIVETDPQGQAVADRLMEMDTEARLAILNLMNAAMHEARYQGFPSFTETSTVLDIEIHCTWKKA